VPSTFVVRQAEADDTATGVARRESGECPRVEWVSRAVRGDDDANADARLVAGLGRGIEDQLDRRRQAAEAGGI
jgi:hypothetical protein